MFFPATSTVSHQGSRCPFFRPGDTLCYTGGAAPQFFVIGDITLDRIATTVGVKFEFDPSLPLVAARAYSAPDASSAQVPTIGMREQYLRAVRRDLELFTTLLFA